MAFSPCRGSGGGNGDVISPVLLGIAGAGGAAGANAVVVVFVADRIDQ